MSFVLISDPRIKEYGLEEGGDPLVDAAGRHEIAISPKRILLNPWHTFVRSAVLERLLTAARYLPHGVQLCLEEGYRPLDVQRLLFEEYLELLQSELGQVGTEHLVTEATKYVAQPEGAPPHTTGGAVDVALLTGEGEEIDMGSTSDDTPLRNGSRNFTRSKAISETARGNRMMLVNAMTRAGFVNYPAEWWHWSYGDQYWAFRSRRAKSFYGTLPITGDVRPLPTSIALEGKA
jgi:zinc D-Ala-D-Ala dipeptidase